MTRTVSPGENSGTMRWAVTARIWSRSISWMMVGVMRNLGGLRKPRTESATPAPCPPGRASPRLDISEGPNAAGVLRNLAGLVDGLAWFFPAWAPPVLLVYRCSGLLGDLLLGNTGGQLDQL